MFYVDIPKLTSVKLDLFPCLARDGKSPPKKLICIGEKSVPQTACLSSEVKKYTAELHSGHRATLYHKGLKCQQQFAQSCLQEGELSNEIDDVPSRLA